MSFRMPDPKRMLQVSKLRAMIFDLPFNPQRLRLGTRVLQQKLKGEHMQKWYLPPNNLFGTAKQLTNEVHKKYGSPFIVRDVQEDFRLKRLEVLRARGKGAPKKKKEKRVEFKKRK